MMSNNIDNIKWVKNHEKTTQVERMILKIVPKIVNLFNLIVKMYFQISKLKKGGFDDPVAICRAAS